MDSFPRLSLLADRYNYNATTLDVQAYSGHFCSESSSMATSVPYRFKVVLLGEGE
jgi:hypothetical protein